MTHRATRSVTTVAALFRCALLCSSLSLDGSGISRLHALHKLHIRYFLRRCVVCGHARILIVARRQHLIVTRGQHRLHLRSFFRDFFELARRDDADAPIALHLHARPQRLGARRNEEANIARLHREWAGVMGLGDLSGAHAHALGRRLVTVAATTPAESLCSRLCCTCRLQLPLESVFQLPTLVEPNTSLCCPRVAQLQQRLPAGAGKGDPVENHL